MIGLMCPKELMLTKPMVCKSVLSAITGAFLRKILDFSQKCGCHDLMLKAMNFNDVVIVSVR